jgi:hypothetical protein
MEVPIGSWGGRMGTSLVVNLMAEARALEVPIVHQAKLATKEQFDHAISIMEYEYKTLPSAFWTFYCTYGQK